MKKFTYQLTHTDIKTILVTLTVMLEKLPQLELDELSLEEIQYAVKYGKSVSKKLSNMEEIITNNELSSIHISLQLAYMINQGDVIVDDYSYNLCREYVFDINRLLPVFEVYFEN